MKHAKPQKYRSRIVSLLLMAGLLWGAFSLSILGTVPPAFKMFAAYVSWGMMIYLLMGFFFARKPSRTVALLGVIAALGAELGRFDLTSMTQTAGEMPIFLAFILVVSLICYSLGIGVGWLLENLTSWLWRLLWPKTAHA